MKLFIFLLSLFLAVNSFGQSSNTLKQLLKARDFIALNQYMSAQKNNNDCKWETLRNIVGDYQEGTIALKEIVPSGNRTIVNNYWIDLLATKTNIFYYKLTNTHYDTTGRKLEETIDSLSDNNQNILLEQLFKTTYGAPLNHDDLFRHIIYGSGCGIADAPTEYMEHLNMLLENNHIDTIRQWLQSANAEKQLYALYGYRKLLNNDYELTVEERRLIPIVEKKTGIVATCGGCFFGHQNFETVVEEINSIPAKYLVIRHNAPRSNALVFGLLAAIGAIIILAISYFTRERKR